MTSEKAAARPALERLLERLEGVEGSGNQYNALCPAHDDNDPSLSVSLAGENGTSKVLLHCFAGCETRDVLDAVGLEYKDLFPPVTKAGLGHVAETYDYTDTAGNLVCQTVRYEPKDFRQRRPNGNGGWLWNLQGVDTPLYNLPAVNKAIEQGEPIYVVEGEKDADRATSTLGVTVTTCPMGAKKWKHQHTESLRGANVVVIADNDLSGRGHARMVAEELSEVAANIRVVEALPGAPEKEDLSDWVDAGGTREDLESVAANTDSFLSNSNVGVGLNRKLLPFKTVADLQSEGAKGADWIVKPFIVRGAITDISGTAKRSGKTTLIMDMLRCLSAGEEFMGEQTKVTPVLYLTEQGANILEAIRRAGIDPQNGSLHFLQWRDTMGWGWADVVEAVKEQVREVGAGLVVIDTLNRFAGLSGEKENQAGEVMAAMNPLLTLAQELNVGVLCVRHANKEGQGRGSTAFDHDVDIQLTLKRPQGGYGSNVREIEGVGRYDDIHETLLIELTEDGYEVLGTDRKAAFNQAVKALRTVAPSNEGDAMTEAGLLDAMKGEAEVSRSTGKRAIGFLHEEGALQRIGKGVRGEPYTFFLTPPPEIRFKSSDDRNAIQSNEGGYMDGNESGEDESRDETSADLRLTTEDVRAELDKSGGEPARVWALYRFNLGQHPRVLEELTTAVLAARGMDTANWQDHTAPVRSVVEEKRLAPFTEEDLFDLFAADDDD